VTVDFIRAKGVTSIGVSHLIRHPDSPVVGATQISASLALGPYGFGAQFLIHGDASLVLPTRRKPRRTDGLWAHTCLELFLKPAGSEHYFEFNFAPSTLWAAYALDGYRSGMEPLHMAAPSFNASPLKKSDIFLLRAQMDWHGREKVKSWQVGLSAVIETTSGERSYWAVRHPPGKPDFHHPDCFALELPAPDDA